MKENDALHAPSGQCLFCRIVKGEIPSKKVYEDRDVIAFLDINPANPGHTLVVPKKHSEDITKAGDELEKTIEVVKKISFILKEKMHAAGVNVVQNNGHVAGQLVAHLHFHVIPRYPNDHVVISYPRASLSESDMEEIRKKMTETPSHRDMDISFD